MLNFFLDTLIILRCARVTNTCMGSWWLWVRTRRVGVRQGWQRAGECMKGCCHHQTFDPG